MKKLFIFDIDDTILKADVSNISIYKIVNGKRIAISTEQFAKEEDGDNPLKFDLSEFGDSNKIAQSIENGKPIEKTLSLLDKKIKEDYVIGFITARQKEDVVYDSIYKFLQHRAKFLNKDYCFAVNDVSKNYKGKSTPLKKANILKKLCKHFSKVEYIDDDLKNVNSAKSLGLKNLEVMIA